MSDGVTYAGMVPASAAQPGTVNFARIKSQGKRLHEMGTNAAVYANPHEEDVGRQVFPRQLLPKHLPIPVSGTAFTSASRVHCGQACTLAKSRQGHTILLNTLQA